ncbi:MAG: hypothetical protein JXR10_11615 [Cyclobacteriaceae bacterium]
MSLLDKVLHFKVSGLAIALIPFFFACDDPTGNGLDLDSTENPIKVESLEFELPSSTIYIDSLRTDEYAYSLFGQYQDSIVGSVKALSFNRYNRNSISILQGTEADEDSLAYVSSSLVLKIIDARTPGSISDDIIRVHQALDTIYNQPVYLSNREMEYDPEPIGELSFDFDDNSDSILTIPLNEEFGMFMYEKLDKAKDLGDYRDSLFSNLYHYPALSLIPGESNQGLYHLDLTDDTTRINIVLQSINTGELYTSTFDLVRSHYTQVIRDKSTGKLTDLTEDYSVSNVESSLVYLNSIAGVYPEISLKPFEDFIKANEDFIINRATLTMGVSASPDSLNYVNSLNAFFRKENGRINSSGVELGNGYFSALLSEGAYTGAVQNPPAAEINFNTDDFNYQKDVTLFCQELADYYNAFGNPLTEKLVLLNTNRIDLNHSSLIKQDIKLTIYYTSLKE